eukprot:TRINITY_DN952_c0_g6_i1.p1 TRINITY_DN952_c0_g6~~TRINITY_DN952_c0_g6_i1.p1  ORF type:complete len:440 (+),score=87.04 TRINITY_DN952_c0_g6_i1:83-1402(+)
MTPACPPPPVEPADDRRKPRLAHDGPLAQTPPGYFAGTWDLEAGCGWPDPTGPATSYGAGGAGWTPDGDGGAWPPDIEDIPASCARGGYCNGSGPGRCLTCPAHGSSSARPAPVIISPPSYLSRVHEEQRAIAASLQQRQREEEAAVTLPWARQSTPGASSSCSSGQRAAPPVTARPPTPPKRRQNHARQQQAPWQGKPQEPQSPGSAQASLEHARRIAALEQENATLQRELEQLRAKANAPPTSAAPPSSPPPGQGAEGAPLHDAWFRVPLGPSREPGTTAPEPRVDGAIVPQSLLSQMPLPRPPQPSVGPPPPPPPTHGHYVPATAQDAAPFAGCPPPVLPWITVGGQLLRPLIHPEVFQTLAAQQQQQPQQHGAAASAAGAAAPANRRRRRRRHRGGRSKRAKDGAAEGDGEESGEEEEEEDGESGKDGGVERIDE